MYGGKQILAIIPARGGSKGLPGKNLRVLKGKPLICWTVRQALECDYFDEIFVSTDSKEIADVAKKCGIDVPFLRPNNLATDSATSAAVVMHVLDYFRQKGHTFDYFVLLEPTSPLRQKKDLNKIVELAIEKQEKDGVVSLGEIHLEHPSIAKKVACDDKIFSYFKNDKTITQRQQVDKAYFPYGVAYMVKTDVFLNKLSFYSDNSAPYFLERWQNYEIDDIYDFICVESIMEVMKGCIYE